MDVKTPKMIRTLAASLKVAALPIMSTRDPIKNPPTVSPERKVNFILEKNDFKIFLKIVSKSSPLSKQTLVNAIVGA